MPNHYPGRSREEIDEYKKRLKTIPYRDSTVDEAPDSLKGSTEGKVEQEGKKVEKEEARELNLLLKIKKYPYIYGLKIIGSILGTILLGIIANHIYDYFSTIYDNNVLLNTLIERISNIKSDINIMNKDIGNVMNKSISNKESIIEIKNKVVNMKEFHQLKLTVNNIQNELENIKELLESGIN